LRGVSKAPSSFIGFILCCIVFRFVGLAFSVLLFIFRFKSAPSLVLLLRGTRRRFFLWACLHRRMPEPVILVPPRTTIIILPSSAPEPITARSVASLIRVRISTACLIPRGPWSLHFHYSVASHLPQKDNRARYLNYPLLFHSQSPQKGFVINDNLICLLSPSSLFFKISIRRNSSSARLFVGKRLTPKLRYPRPRPQDGHPLSSRANL